MVGCKRTGKTEKDLTITKKKFSYEAVVVDLKKEKKITAFYHFSTLNLNFPDLFQVWIIAWQ